MQLTPEHIKYIRKLCANHIANAEIEHRDLKLARFRAGIANVSEKQQEITQEQHRLELEIRACEEIQEALQ
jgi:hypothetical protein